MRDIAITLLVFIGLIYTLKRPYVGILLWSWLGYMNPHKLAYGFAYNMPYAQLTMITLLFALLFSKEPKNFPVTSVTVVWLIFIIYMTIGTFFAVMPDDAFLQLIKVYKIQFAIFLTFLLINTKERIIQLVWVIALSIGYFGIKGGIFTILTGGNYRVWGPSETYIGGNNEIGLAVLMIIPLFFYLKTLIVNKWGKGVLWACILWMFFTVLGTHSRGAFLGLFCMLFFLWLKTPNKLVTGVVITLLIISSLSIMPDAFFSRMESIETYEQDASAMQRFNSWSTAINIASDRFFAGGFEHWSVKTFAQYAPVPDDVHDAHSIYFEVLGEHGVMGLFIFLLIFFLTWKNSLWIIKKSKNMTSLLWAGDLAKMIQVSFIAYASGGAFLGLAYWDLPYHLIAIIVLTKEVVIKELINENEQKTEKNKFSTQEVVLKERRKWAWEK